MAKQKMQVGTGGFSFSDLNKGLKAFSPDSVILSEDSNSIKIMDFIGTGNYTLNAQISGSIYGGIPVGKITMIAGPSGTGKTYLCLNIVRCAQQKGYDIIWIDSESALDTESLDRFGIDREKFSYNPMGLINDVTSYIANLSKILTETKKTTGEVPKILVVVDSLGNLSSSKEHEDSVKGVVKQDMTRPKELRKLFRVVTKELGMLKIPMVVTNHVYAKQDLFGGNEISGGGGAIFNASTILSLSKANLKDSSGQKTGIIITSKIYKSRMTKAGIDVKFHLSFHTGMNPYTGLYEYCSWDDCGIEIGKYEKGIFKPSSKAVSVAVKHLNGNVPAKQLFTSKVFTKEVLDILEPQIKKIFELPPLNSDNIDLDVELNGLVDEELEIPSED